MFDVDVLPPRPLIDVTGLEYCPPGHCYLAEAEYVEGYPPITEKTFARLKSMESTWKGASARASVYAYEQGDKLWRKAKTLDLASLGHRGDAVPDSCGASDLRHLRLCYPELATLADEALCCLFDAYNQGCCYTGRWTARRDDAFLFFLLGTLASKSLAQTPMSSEEAKEAGAMAGFALLRGENVTSALELALAWHRYNEAFAALASALAEGMQLYRRGN